MPYWRSNVDAQELFEKHAHSPKLARNWFRHHKIPFNCPALGQAVTMRGMFALGYLPDHSFTWTFTPGVGGRAVVLPVYENYRLVDLLAISRDSPDVWGCVTGTALSAGATSHLPLRVYRTPLSWLHGKCKGVLPLANKFFPLLQASPEIVADNDDHAWKLAERVFVNPAISVGADGDAAEDEAFSRISLAVAA